MSIESEGEQIERSLKGRAVELAVGFLGGQDFAEVDVIALIVNDHEGAEHFSVELWWNSKTNVTRKIGDGASPQKARWLYEYWSPEGVLGEVVGDSANDAAILSEWRRSVDRERLYRFVIAVAHTLRAAIPGLRGIPILVDNNHDYDRPVFEAIAAANPSGQAEEWFRHPPPDCE